MNLVGYMVVQRGVRHNQKLVFSFYYPGVAIHEPGWLYGGAEGCVTTRN
jgi:hypothetical protein